MAARTEFQQMSRLDYERVDNDKLEHTLMALEAFLDTQNREYCLSREDAATIISLLAENQLRRGYYGR